MLKVGNRFGGIQVVWPLVLTVTGLLTATGTRGDAGDWCVRTRRSSMVVSGTVNSLSWVKRADRSRPSVKEFPDGSRLARMRDPSDYILGRSYRVTLDGMYKGWEGFARGDQIEVFVRGLGRELHEAAPDGRLISGGRYLFFLVRLSPNRAFAGLSDEDLRGTTAGIPGPPVASDVVYRAQEAYRPLEDRLAITPLPIGSIPPAEVSACSTLPAEPPGVVTTLAPSGTGAASEPAFAWQPLADANWYAISASTFLGLEVVTAIVKNTDVCDWGPCSMTSPTTLAPGTYSWRAQAGNAFGYGLWSAPMVFQVGQNAAPVVTGGHVIEPAGLGDHGLFVSGSDPDSPMSCDWSYDSEHVFGSNMRDVPAEGGTGELLARLKPGTNWEAVTHTCTDYWGAVGSTTFYLNLDVNGAPTVSISAPASCNAPCTVTFTATASDPELDPLVYSWSGCASGTATTATCSIATNGQSVTATVWVWDGHGGSATASKTAVGAPLPPAASGRRPSG